MSVDTQHPDFSEMLPLWETCKDAIRGEAAVKKAGVKYLPKLVDQDPCDYETYKDRAVYYNASRRTLTGLAGLLTRKKFVQDSSTVELFEDDITSDGKSLGDLASEVIHEVMGIGRVGLLVDMPPVEINPGMTVAESEASSIRPRICNYCATSIINWRVEKVGNKDQLVLLVLQEKRKNYKDEFKFSLVVVYRVLSMDNGVYIVRVFEKDKDGKSILLEEFVPQRNGKPLDAIPFVFINKGNLSATPQEPPLLDLINLNMAHYRVSADYEHGCHFTGLPTPVVTGHNTSSAGEKFYIGSTAAWVFSDPNAKAFYLEFSGQGLGTLENNMKTKEDQMAVLGARMLATDKKGVEAAETAAIRRAGENSALSSIGHNISRGISNALTLFNNWAGSDQQVEFILNSDFSDMGLTSQDLTALVGAWQSGAISHETLFNNLKAGEIYEDSDDFETEQTRIDDAVVNRPSTESPGGPISSGGTGTGASD